MFKHTGATKIYNSEETAQEAIINNKVVRAMLSPVQYEDTKGSVVLEILMKTDAIIFDHYMNGTVKLVTDRRFSGFIHDSCIGHVSPEVASCGSIAFVEDRDIININDIIGFNGKHKVPEEVETVIKHS